MTDLLFIVLPWAVGFVLLAPVGIALAAYVSVKRMSGPELRVDPIAPEARPDSLRRAEAYAPWAEAQGFERIGSFRMSAGAEILIAAWRHRERPTYFCMYMHGARTHVDLVSIYDDEHLKSVTTGNAIDGLLLPPPPGAHVQVFPGLEPEQLLERHRSADELVRSMTGTRPRALEDRRFEDVLLTAIHEQMAHVRSIPAWPIQAIGWYLVRRHRRAGRSIELEMAAPGSGERRRAA